MSILGLSLPPPPPLRTEAEEAAELAQRLQVVLAGRYEVMRALGRGGMATVFLVRHRRSAALFAVKVLHPSLASDHEFTVRFRREALHAACLSGHPHIVSIIDVEESDGLHYLLMPYVRGEDLDHMLARTGPFPLREALETIAQVNDALAYAATKGLNHGDLTPGNVRLTEFHRFVVLDFGLSRAIDRGELNLRSRVRLGTPYYMSPEQIRNDSLDIRSDLYSLGAILHELLFGRAPFDGQTLSEIEKEHLTGVLALPPEFAEENAEVAHLLTRLLAKSPGERFPSPAELDEALTKVGAARPRFPLAPMLAGGDDVRPPRRRLSGAAAEIQDVPTQTT